MDPKEIQEKIDKRYCQELLRYLNSKSITRERTHETSSALLALEPFVSMADAKSKLEFYSQKFPEFAAVEQYVLAIESEEKTKHIVAKMSDHLRQNNIDAALAVAQAI